MLKVNRRAGSALGPRCTSKSLRLGLVPIPGGSPTFKSHTEVSTDTCMSARSLACDGVRSRKRWDNKDGVGVQVRLAGIGPAECRHDICLRRGKSSRQRVRLRHADKLRHRKRAPSRSRTSIGRELSVGPGSGPGQPTAIWQRLQCDAKRDRAAPSPRVNDKL